MPITPGQVIMWAWLAWLISWFAAALWSNRTTRRAGLGAEFWHMLVTIVGMFLVFATADGGAEPAPSTWRFNAPWSQLWSTPGAVGWALTVVAIAGFAICWWARLHLGPLWSGQVMRKEGHRIVDTGPYALVRHPIYTGLILAALATALLKGSALNLVGAGLMAWGLAMKARLEERFLGAELGDEAYESYKARVPMLIPGVGARR